MNIWGWVEDTIDQLQESGHHRLAQAMWEIAGHATQGRVDQLDALYPEAVAEARALELDWVEVFLRHWRLQSRINELQHGEAALAEAVDLLEFAHRERTSSCPQAICVVQDFTIAHGRADGPGYVAERQAVLDETFPRIDPGWNCFDCLSREYADTLIDDGRPDEALTYLSTQCDRMRAARNDPSLSVTMTRTGALDLLGRHDEALAELDATAKLVELGQGEQIKDDLPGRRARILAHAGRFEEAAEVLPDADVAERRPSLRPDWVEAAEHVALAGHLTNDWRLGRRITEWAAYLAEVGAYRPALDMTLSAGRLAVARGARPSAEFLLARLRVILGKLRATEEPARRIDELAAAVAAVPVLALGFPDDVDPLTASAEEIRDVLPTAGDGADPEVHSALLHTVIDARGGAASDDREVFELVEALVAAQTAAGFASEAATLLWARVENAANAANAASDETHAADLLANVLLDDGSDADVQRLYGILIGRHPTRAHWLTARRAASRGRWADAAEACAQIVALDDTVVNARRLWGHAAVRQEDFATALRVRGEILARTAEDDDMRRSDEWDHVVAATAAHDWEAVRAGAAVLGLEFEAGEGPIDEEWHVVYLRIATGDGSAVVVPGMRTGPVSARLLPVLPPSLPYNVHDVVVYEPTPVSPPPEDEAERENWVPTFDALTMLDDAGYTSHFVDGVWPGDEAWHALRAFLGERGYAIWHCSPDDYTVTDPAGVAAGDEDAVLPGMYAWVGAPPAYGAQETDGVLTEGTAHWAHPLAWPVLAKDAGTDVDRHLKIVADYGL